jgi:competence protein ComEA
MKLLPGKQFITWFGYSRRERRASFILLILIVVVAGARFTVPQSDMEISIIAVDSVTSLQALPVKSIQDTLKVVQKSVRRDTKNKPLLELNTCDSALLERLPGIGPVLSGRIIKYRNLLGGFASVNQLIEVYGLPQETFDIICSRVMADSTIVRKININNADFRQLIRLPYFERYEVNAILKYRELQGRITGINELFDNKLVAPEKKKKVMSYLEF